MGITKQTVCLSIDPSTPTGGLLLAHCSFGFICTLLMLTVIPGMRATMMMINIWPILVDTHSPQRVGINFSFRLYKVARGFLQID